MTTTSAPPPEQPSPLASATDAIDLHAYWRTLAKRRWLAIPFFVTVVLLTILLTLRQTRIYDATVTLVIDLNAPRVLDKDVQDVVETGTGSYWFSREYYETQYKIIASRAVSQRVSDQLQLGSNLAFLRLDGIKDPAELERARQARDPVAVLQTGLKVEPVKDSRVVRIRYEHPDPQLAALVANTFADAYIAESLSVRTNTTASASEWLEGQLGDLERKLDESSKALFEFKQKNDIVAASWEDRQSMVSQRLTAINDALTKARVRKAELEARNEAVQSIARDIDKGTSVESLPAVASNPTIQQLKLKYFEARAECADMKVKYLEGHPKLEACEKQLGSAKQALQDEVNTSLEAAKKEYQEVSKTERNLLALLNETKTDAFALNQHERDYLELKRTYDNNQRLYEQVLKRLKDTGVTGMLALSNVRVLDRARPANRPIRPNTTRNIALAIVLGLIGGIGLAFLAEALDTSLTSQEQIEEKLGITFLGIVPSIKPNKDGTPQDLVLHTQPKSPVAECVRAVRTNLLFMSPEKPLRTILVTSSSPQEGKTTTATSLAIAMTSSGQRVLLVDADMRRPRIHRIFGIENRTGLSSLILGEGKLGETVKETAVPGLWVLPCGPVPPNPAELLHTDAFKRLVDEMAGQFDRVILDSPPVLAVSESKLLAALADQTVFIVRWGKTKRETAMAGLKELVEAGADVVGVLFSQVDTRRHAQYEFPDSGRYHGYRRYYVN